MVNRYEILPADLDGNPAGPMFAFAQQKRMKLKEEVIFYTDDQKTTPVFRFKARNVLDVHGVTDVFDPQGQPIGLFRKDFAASLLRSTWFFSSGGAPELRGEERSQLVAPAPPLHEHHLHPVPLRLHPPDGTIAFSVEKKWGIRDKYKVTVWDASLDWRVVAAMAVALDALQHR